MSHFVEIKTNFLQKHEAHLIAALEEFFGTGKVEVHENGAELRSYAGQLASKAGLGETTPCHLIVRRKALEEYIGHPVATNDAGFARNDKDGYNVYIDQAGFTKETQGLLNQSYALRVAESQLAAEGYSLERIHQDDGSVRVEARIYA